MTLSAEEAKLKLLRYWKTEKLQFIAEFHRPKNKVGGYSNSPYGYFRDIRIADKDRIIIYPKMQGYEFNRTISFKYPLLEGLIDGQYYEIEFELDSAENRKHNPFQLKVLNYKPVDDYRSPQDFIKYWFSRKGENPGDASTIASQLKLNELELYTHTKRFVFELIQNADDMPLSNDGVNIELYLLKNHLLFLHNGQYFTRDNVRAISDAAKSTKTKSETQTGYKGIGFKSVFTDSNRVYIKSADYSFKFDKLAPIYKDFWSLYSDYYNSKTPSAKKDFEVEYRGLEQHYTNIDLIPWQIKPIWVEWHDYPEELKNSPFFSNQQVAIALEVGEVTLKQKDYEGMIYSLIREPRFLLFLRKTKTFSYKPINSPEPVTISVRENQIGLDVFKNNELISSYVREDFHINIQNEDFEKAGLNFKRREVDGGKIEFHDADDQKLENIPEKLGRLNKTSISFAAKINGSAIEELGKDETILFNYLPTSDQRFGFPYLVNADFISKSDREFIQIENLWNHYLFYHIGFKTIEWISNLGSAVNNSLGKKYFPYAKTYLNLLPVSLLDERNEELATINKAFNNGIREGIKEVPFIIDSRGFLKKCEEIIIDDTGISSVLGALFFKEVSATPKALPHLIINHQKLKTDYLNIERFSIENLVAVLSTTENKALLSSSILSLNEIKYSKFLEWLDGVYLRYSGDRDWLLNLPIIRSSDTVYSLNDVLLKEDFYLKTFKIKDIEGILSAIGYELSSFYIDDYQNIHNAVLSKSETYLNIDIKIYERIAANTLLHKLNASEKNSLLYFFERLDHVGKTKFAHSIKLFQSSVDNGKLKPLGSLITNTCPNLPSWLADFVINQQEENGLTSGFRKYLIKQDELLEKIFCNPSTFDELKSSIEANQVNSFYTYILELYQTLPTDKKLIYTSIPWLYLDSTDTFQLPAEAYCPDSLLNLDQDKYERVKYLLETVSEEKLPVYSSLCLVKSFALGCKKIAVSQIISRSSSFDLVQINDFLDWLKINGERSFLQQYTLIKNEDLFFLSRTPGTQQYHSDDPYLVEAIGAINSVSPKLVLLPSELYSADRKDIGLLEGNELLEYLIKNGLSSIQHVDFIYKAKETALKKLFIDQLTSIDLHSTLKYDKESDVHKVFEIIVDLGRENEKLYDNVINKITIDGHSLNNKNISDDVVFTFPHGVNPPERRYELKLSDILSNYKNETESLTIVINNFVDFKHITSLRKVFKTSLKKHTEIFNEIHSSSIEYLSPHQLLFLLLYKENNPSLDIRKGKIDFDEFFQKKNDIKHREYSLLMLNLFYEYNYSQFQSSFFFDGFSFSQKILDEESSLAQERLPSWILEWLDSDDKEKKVEFLFKSGLNSRDSSVVMLRKGIIKADKDCFEKGLANTDSTVQLSNTLEWLLLQQEERKTHFSQEFLKPLYAKLENKKVPINTLPIPVIKTFGVDSFHLLKQSSNQVLHYAHSGWGDLGHELFSSITSSGGYVMDGVLSDNYKSILKPVVSNVSKEPDEELLRTNSKLFNEPYYANWLLKDNYPIFIYEGGSMLPHQIKYHNLFTKQILEGKVLTHNKSIYITADEVKELPYPLKAVLPTQVYNDLSNAKSEYERKLRKEQYEIKYSVEEALALHRLFGDDIPRSFHKDLNLSALIKGLVYLTHCGYDTSEAEENLKETHEYSQLYPVYPLSQDKSDINALTIKCRSAKSGLLYLRASSWRDLKDDNTYLYVLTGNNNTDCELFKTREEVVKDDKADYRVLRVESNGSTNELDEIVEGRFNLENMWLIIRMADKKEYKSIFEKIREKEADDSVDNLNLGNEDFD